MIIGLPKALLYHQYGVLWESFFTGLGCKVVVSNDTNEVIFEDGVRDAVSECCLPAKAYLGHVRSLLGRCDYILSPYATKKSGGDTICTRFWGMGDVVRHTYPDARLLEYDISGDNAKVQKQDFYLIGRKLGKSLSMIRLAYKSALAAQNLHDKKLREAQNSLLSVSGLKVMIAGHPYVLHDPYIGGSVVRILAEMGVTPFFSDRFNRNESMLHAGDISPRLYWTANRETVGAIAAHKKELDGVLLLTAFPCAPDALVCDMTLRVVNDIPITLILLDGLQGEAGLQTRIESFIDILLHRQNRKEQKS